MWCHVKSEKYVKLTFPFARKEHLESLQILSDAVAATESGERLVVDMVDLDMVDSFAISRFLKAYRELTARDASIVLVNAPEQAEQTMRMTGVFDLLTEGDSSE